MAVFAMLLKVTSRITCGYYLISTDGSGRQRHPDQQALLRILKYSRMRPCLAFNYETEATLRWHDFKNEVPDLGVEVMKHLSSRPKQRFGAGMGKR